MATAPAVGDVLNEYEVMTPFSTAGGGNSRWAMACKGGRPFFLKEFLAPLYPLAGAPGGADTLAHRRRLCARFEARIGDVTAKLRGVSSETGLVVTTREFFRVENRYFRSTTFIDGVTLTHEAVAMLDLRQQLSIVVSILQSVELLQSRGIVHGDLRPKNCMVALEPRPQLYLIDIDTCWSAGDTYIDAADIVGDPAYYSPEMLWAMKSGDSRYIGVESDVFAAAVLIVYILTGELPAGRSHRTAAGAVAAGERLLLALSGRVSMLRPLIESILTKEPRYRLSAAAAKMAVVRLRAGLSETSRPATYTLSAQQCAGFRPSESVQADSVGRQDVGDGARRALLGPSRGELEERWKAQWASLNRLHSLDLAVPLMPSPGVTGVDGLLSAAVSVHRAMRIERVLTLRSRGRPARPCPSESALSRSWRAEWLSLNGRYRTKYPLPEMPPGLTGHIEVFGEAAREHRHRRGSTPPTSGLTEPAGPPAAMGVVGTNWLSRTFRRVVGE